MVEEKKALRPKGSKSSKLTINVETTFSLIGICSIEPIYRLSNELNDRLKVNFTCDHVISFVHKKSQEQLEFATFVSEDPSMRMRLIANKYEQYCLFDELKHYDYLLQLDGEWEDGELGYISYCIRNSAYAQFVANINVARLKNKDKIFF